MREFSLALWSWCWLVVHEVTGSIPAQTLNFCHAFIHLFLFLWTLFTRQGQDPELGEMPRSAEPLLGDALLGENESRNCINLV